MEKKKTRGKQIEFAFFVVLVVLLLIFLLVCSWLAYILPLNQKIVAVSVIVAILGVLYSMLGFFSMRKDAKLKEQKITDIGDAVIKLNVMNELTKKQIAQTDKQIENLGKLVRIKEKENEPVINNFE